jgi:hypothetical protein
MKFESIEKAALIAEQALPVIEQLKQITNKAKTSDKPLKDQLPTEDVIEFAELSERMKTMTLAQLIESRRQRDLMVIEQMVMMADREYRWKDHPSENDGQAFTIYSALQLLKLSIEKNNITVPDGESCILDYALHMIEKEGIEKLAAIKGVLSVGSSIQAILDKYGMEKLDRSRLSKADLDKINELETNVLQPAERLRSFIKDLENIKLMARASEIMYEANKQDIAFGGGNIDAIGMTIQKKSIDKEFDEDMQLTIGLWTMINDKIPSQLIQDWKEVESQEKEEISDEQ